MSQCRAGLRACLAVLLTLLVLAAGCAGTAKKETTSAESGFRTVLYQEGADQIPIYCYRPASWKQGGPVFLAFPGEHRDAEETCRALQEQADRCGVLVASPLFAEDRYPGSAYNLGRMTVRDNQAGRVEPAAKWTLPLAGKVRDAVLKAYASPDSTVTLFGHSAGSQYLHRYVLFDKGRAGDRYVLANAGWYTMPDDGVRFPYGLQGLPPETQHLSAAFAKPVTVLLGESDIKRSGSLRKTPEADAQGQARLERGRRFYAALQEKARQQGVPFAWHLATVPGVGHDTAAMARAAMKLVYEK